MILSEFENIENFENFFGTQFLLFREQFSLYFIETKYAGWYYEKLELYSFWTKLTQNRKGKVGVTQIGKFPNGEAQQFNNML